MLVCRGRIRGDIRRLPAENVRLAILVNSKASPLGLTQHPPQRNLGELTLRLGITAADVRVHAGEPHFLDILLGVVRVAERVLAEEGATLINGNGVPHDIEVGVLGRSREWKVHRVVHPSYGADRIPHPDEVRLAFTCEGVLEISGDREIDLLALDHPDRIGNQGFVTLGQQADDVEHPTQRSCCVCPPTEPKDVQPVAGCEFSHEKLVRVSNVVGNPIPKGETEDTGPPLLDLRERGARPHRPDTGVVIGDLRRVADQRLIELYDVRVLRSKLIARAIAADNDVLGHDSGLTDDRKCRNGVNLPSGRSPVPVSSRTRVFGLGFVL